MVITSPTLLARSRGADKYWKQRRILRLSAHYYGRRQNCYSIAIRSVRRALQYSTLHRRLNKVMYKTLWEGRINASCQELGTTYNDMYATMDQAGVALDRKILQNLAIWEPRSFRALALLTKAKQEEEGLNSLDGPVPAGVVTRGML
ncbi:hypothetical protein Pcinc_033840 [Petrolisthes cinctipes]|uniref:Ribosomal protein L20 n=1 Tax=Petrolisthes cinctipes TaxID=88211 RepID=A0AAE1ERL1_PETCI|nr:hypothetical protein Pcinc_033840 [Petrolisthes cinctipes]